jgi:hypothetical protein
MLDGPVDIGASTPAALVVERSPISSAGEHEAVLDPLRGALVPEQPGDCADRPRQEQEAISVAAGNGRQDPRQRGGKRDT